MIILIPMVYIIMTYIHLTCNGVHNLGDESALSRQLSPEYKKHLYHLLFVKVHRAYSTHQFSSKSWRESWIRGFIGMICWEGGHVEGGAPFKERGGSFYRRDCRVFGML